MNRVTSCDQGQNIQITPSFTKFILKLNISFKIDIKRKTNSR